MRRLVVFTVLSTALAVPAAASAVLANGGGNGDGALSVKSGVGRVTLYPFNGAAVGRLAHGKVVLTDPIADDGIGSQVWGCDNSPGGLALNATTIVCSGENLRFRAAGGKYKIFIRGSGIFLSAVGRGVVTLNGDGDGPSVFSDGLFSINDSAYRSLPNEPKPFQLAPPPGG